MLFESVNVALLVCLPNTRLGLAIHASYLCFDEGLAFAR